MIFYTKLFSSKSQRPQDKKHILNVGSEGIPETTEEEIDIALKQMRKNMCPGEDQITVEMLTLNVKPIKEATQFLITNAWNSEVILFFKKNNNANIENHRPIYLSHLCKLFTKITNRLMAKLNFYQPIERQALERDLVRPIICI